MTPVKCDYGLGVGTLDVLAYSYCPVIVCLRKQIIKTKAFMMTQILFVIFTFVRRCFRIIWI